MLVLVALLVHVFHEPLGVDLWDVVLRAHHENPRPCRTATLSTVMFEVYALPTSAATSLSTPSLLQFIIAFLRRVVKHLTTGGIKFETTRDFM